MIVVVESNFVIEIAALQEDYEAAEAIVAHAEAKDILLAIPAFALAEPFMTFKRWENERKETVDRLDNQLSQLSRSRDYRQLAQAPAAIRSTVIKAGAVLATRLNQTIQRLLKCARVLELDDAVTEEGLKIQNEHDLSPQDALVLVSVRRFLEEEKKASVFANKNSKDFLRPEIADQLKAIGCTVIPSFQNALAYVEKHRADRNNS